MSRRRAPPPLRLAYWFDRCLGRAAPDAFEREGFETHRYEELYPDEPDVADALWIPAVTARGWVIVTKDAAITRNPAEIAALRQASARFVCLAAQGMTGPDQIECLLRHWRTVEGQLRSRKPPVIVKVLRREVQRHDGGGWRRVKKKPPR